MHTWDKIRSTLLIPIWGSFALQQHKKTRSETASLKPSLRFCPLNCCFYPQRPANQTLHHQDIIRQDETHCLTRGMLSPFIIWRRECSQACFMHIQKSECGHLLTQLMKRASQTGASWSSIGRPSPRPNTVPYARRNVNWGKDRRGEFILRDMLKKYLLRAVLGGLRSVMWLNKVNMTSLYFSPLSSWSCSRAVCSCLMTACPPRAPSSAGTFLAPCAVGITTRPPCPGPWWSACHRSVCSVPGTSTWSHCRSSPLWSPSPSWRKVGLHTVSNEISTLIRMNEQYWEKNNHLVAQWGLQMPENNDFKVLNEITTC